MDKHTLLVNVLKLTDVGGELANASTEIRNYNAELYQAVADLNSGWSGQSYDAFVEMMGRYKKSLESFPDLFDAYAGKVNEFDVQGDELISKVAKELKVGIATSYYYQYNMEDNDSRVYVDYDVDWNPESNKDARKQAESVRLNLQADIDVLNQELRNIDMNIAALNQNKSLSESEKESYIKQLGYQRGLVEDALEKYEKAKETVDGLLTKRLFGEDGKLIDGYEFFGLKTDDSKANEGTEILKSALTGLPPVSALTESANINAIYTHGATDDYLSRQFNNGTSVSNTMMDAAYNIASKNNETEQATVNGKQVTFFNSKAFVNQGMLDENGYYKYNSDDYGSYTWGQTSAYEDSYGMENQYEGKNGMYDSVVITNDDGEKEYMTYAQYVERYGDKE